MKLPAISSKFTAPKPWQIGVAVGVFVVFLLVAQALSHLMAVKKKHEVQNLQTIGKIGQPWEPVKYALPPPPAAPTPPPPPPPELQKLLPPPPALMAQAPQPRSPLTAEAKGSPKEQAKVDPELAARNAPILVVDPTPAGSGEGHGGNAAIEHRREHGGMGPPDEPGSLGAMLKPTRLAGFKASRLPHPSYTIPEGTQIACHTVQRMTTGLPGLVTAQLDYDQWSADGTIKLLERNSLMLGEVQRGIIAGADRFFVLWNRIRSPLPESVTIEIDSPVTDELGTAGLAPSSIDRHILEKFGAVLAMSTIEAGLQGLSGYLSNLGNNGNNNQNQGLNLNFSQFGSSGSNLAQQLFAKNLNIPDVGTMNNGAPCAAVIARNLDFSDVYNVTWRPRQ